MAGPAGSLIPVGDILRDPFGNHPNNVPPPSPPPPPPAPGNGISYETGPGGRILTVFTDPLTGTKSVLDKYFPPNAPSSGGSSGRPTAFNDSLDAAKSAVSGFLQSQSLADARRLSAFQEMQKVAQFALPDGATQFPGYEEGGLAHQIAASMGMKTFTPPPMTPIKMNPSALGSPAPTDPATQSFLDQVLAAGAARGGARAN